MIKLLDRLCFDDDDADDDDTWRTTEPDEFRFEMESKPCSCSCCGVVAVWGLLVVLVLWVLMVRV